MSDALYRRASPLTAARKPKPAKPAAPGALTIEYITVNALQPYERNARTHSDAQVKQIAASITEFGFTNPILIAEDREIIAGHGRVLAAIRLGLAAVPTITLPGLSPAQRRALRLADNKLALNAGWDDILLRDELAGLRLEDFDLGITGWSDDEIAGILGDAPGLTDPDDAPPVETVVVTRPGDIWLLGAQVTCPHCQTTQPILRKQHDN